MLSVCIYMYVRSLLVGRGATLLDGSLVHQLGLLLLLTALCYGLVAVGLRKGLRLGGLSVACSGRSGTL